MEIRVIIGDKIIKGVTNETGDFSIPLKGIEIGEKDLDANIMCTFRYKRDDKTYFDLYFLAANDRYKTAEVGKNFKLQK
jgi:hypothetical protein